MVWFPQLQFRKVFTHMGHPRVKIVGTSTHRHLPGAQRLRKLYPHAEGNLLNPQASTAGLRLNQRGTNGGFVDQAQVHDRQSQHLKAPENLESSQFARWTFPPDEAWFPMKWTDFCMKTARFHSAITAVVAHQTRWDTSWMISIRTSKSRATIERRHEPNQKFDDCAGYGIRQ